MRATYGALFVRVNTAATVVNAEYNFPGSYSATGITKRATQQTWLDCFFKFVRLAIQSLPYFLFSNFPVQSRVFQFHVFLSRAFYVHSTLNNAFI